VIGVPQFLSHMAYLAHPDRLRKDDPSPGGGGQAVPVQALDPSPGQTPEVPAVSGAACPAVPDSPTENRKEIQGVDLYMLDADPAAFRRVCGGNQQEEEQESCVEIAPLAGVKDAFALRDSKNPGAGSLRFTGAELRAAGMSV